MLFFFSLRESVKMWLKMYNTVIVPNTVIEQIKAIHSNKCSGTGLQQMCLDIVESLKVIATRPQRSTLIVSVSKPGLHCFLSHRSLCPHSPSRPPKPDYRLSVHAQSLLLIRTNVLVTEHTSSFLRPAATGAALPQTIINLKCLPFLSFPTSLRWQQRSCPEALSC